MTKIKSGERMMSSMIILVLITFIVPIVLNIITFSAERNNSDSIYDFVMRPVKAISIFGGIIAGIFLLFIVLSYIGRQFRGMTAAIFILFFLCGVLMILAPVKGFWETTVKGNDVTASRFWVIKEYANISDIEYCQYVKGGIHVYVRGKNTKALSIDSVCNNFSTFEERMEAEGIEIRPYQRKE